MKENFKALYAARFDAKDRAYKNAMWRPICAYINRFVRRDARVVVDVAAIRAR